MAQKKPLDSWLQDFHTTCYGTSCLDLGELLGIPGFLLQAVGMVQRSKMSKNGRVMRSMIWYHPLHVLMPTLIFNSKILNQLQGLQSCKVSMLAFSCRSFETWSNFLSNSDFVSLRTLGRLSLMTLSQKMSLLSSQEMRCKMLSECPTKEWDQIWKYQSWKMESELSLVILPCQY